MLREALDALAKRYGAPKRPRVTDPFEQILYENASYLVDDETRAEVFSSLKKRVGATPTRILAAKRADLIAAIEGGGMRPPMRAHKLVAAAKIAEALGAPLARIVQRPFDEAKKALARFPGVGAPGAQRIALFAGAHALLGLESNGVRVLARLGLAREHASWDKTWREATLAAEREVPPTIAARKRAHLLLRRHGQETCKRTRPLCNECPLADACPSAS
jgi:endonuclease III